jgi:hypothetical protein
MKFLVVGGTVGVLGAVGVVAVASSGGDEPLAAVTTAPGSPAANGTTPATSGPSAPGPTTAGATTAPIAPAGPVTITSGPCDAPGCSTSSSRAAFEFSSDAASTFECSVDGDGFAACTSPHQVAAAPGRHTFRARVAGQGPTVAAFPWKVARDALVSNSTVTSGITQTITGHACGGPTEPWKYTVDNEGSSVSSVYHLHWTFPHGSRSAPVEGTAEVNTGGSVDVAVTINHGHMKIVASGGGFDGVAEADISAHLIGTAAHPRLKFVQSELTGSLAGLAGTGFTIGGGAIGDPIHLGRAAGCP